MNTKKRIAAAGCAILLASQTAVFASSEAVITAVKPSVSEEIIVEDFGFYGTSDNEQPTTAELEAVIKATKPKFDIPAEYSEFEWDYYGGSQHSDPYWTLRWSTPYDAEVYGYASITCGKNGEIRNFNIYSDNDGVSALPVYTKNELVETAKAFVKKISPEANLVFTSANDAYGRYSKYYTYNFKRVENGIDYPENTASVRIDYVSGKVTYCNIQYDHGIAIQSADTVITPEKAAEILGTKQKMVLSYTLLRERDENDNIINKAVLVYSPSESYLSVDAVTGELYDERTTWQTTGGAGGSINAAMKDMVTEDAAESEEAGYRLTEEELAQLEVLKGLITKDQAIAKITENDKLYLDMNLTAISADLSRSYDYYAKNDEKNENYVWNISFSNPMGAEKYDYSYANAQVDAKTGEIISFNSSLRGNYYYEQNELPAPEKKFTKEQSEKIFEDFVKSQIPEKFEKTRKQQGYETNVIKYHTDLTGDEAVRIPVYGAYGVNYVRVNEGIDFTYNSIYGTVDAVTGKISSYGYSWMDDVVFESPSDAMSAQDAFKIYCEKAEFDKYYERYDVYTLREMKAETPEEKFRAFIISLKENYSDYEAIIKKYADGIDVKKVRNAILAADEYGLCELAAEFFGVKDFDMEFFYNSAAELYDRKSTARLVYKTNLSGVRISALRGERVNYSGNPVVEEYTGEFTDISEHWANGYITMLADLGIVERAEKFEPDSFVSAEDFATLLSNAGYYYPVKTEEAGEFTRIDAVKIIIGALGYDKIASLDIYRTDFSDNPLIDPADVGYLAIAYGLDIIDGDAGTLTFRPGEQITKAEAAKLAVETMRASY